MTKSLIPRRPTVMTEAVEFISATTDLMSLARLVAETYQLAVTAPRDLAMIEARHRHMETTERQLHDRMLLALDGTLKERQSQIEFVERMATVFIDLGEYETAQKIISQLIETLRISPLGQAALVRGQP